MDDLVQPLVDYLNSNTSFGLIQMDNDLIICCLNSLGKLGCKFENRARSVVTQFFLTLVLTSVLCIYIPKNIAQFFVRSISIVSCRNIKHMGFEKIKFG